MRSKKDLESVGYGKQESIEEAMKKRDIVCGLELQAHLKMQQRNLLYFSFIQTESFDNQQKWSILLNCRFNQDHDALNL